MSCYVIGKEEYIKAAGVVSGIIEASNVGPRGISIYDYQRNRHMNDHDFYDCFVDLFQMNALNVYEYYSPRHPEDDLYTDSNDYSEIFKEFQQIGRKSFHDKNKLQKIIFNLRDFFQSAEYQTMENDRYYFKMKTIFDNILVTLMGLLYPHECNCWGEFNV